MDYFGLKKMSDQARNQAEKIFISDLPTKEEKLLMISAIEASIYLLGKQAPAIHLARQHFLAAKCFLKIQEYTMASAHAQYCEFLTKSSPDRSVIDEIYSLDILGRCLYLRGQKEKGIESITHAVALIEKVEFAGEVNAFKSYLNVLEKSGLPILEMEAELEKKTVGRP